MNETQKNKAEIRGAWLGFFGSILIILLISDILTSRVTGLTNFPGTLDEYVWYFTKDSHEMGFRITTLLTDVMPLILVGTVSLGSIGVIFSLYRTNIGIRFSGLILFFTSLVSIFLIIAAGSILISQQKAIENFITLYGTEQEFATYGITVPHFNIWAALVLSFFWLIGSFLMMTASPMNEAKFRTRRMKTLARADTAERTGKPHEAIKLYGEAGDISMKLREEDKASEYYAKAREIREVAIQAVLEAEEKQKREELAIRRTKLEEQRREILMRADQAEEKEDWARATVIYKEAAALSVDLGEKKLAAQFTAKAKELQKKAKKVRKDKIETPE